MMKWWPFGKTGKTQQKYDSEIHIKGTRVWLQNLQEVCEKNFDSPTNGKRLIREMQIEWKDAAKRKEIDEARYSISLFGACSRHWGRINSFSYIKS